MHNPVGSVSTTPDAFIIRYWDLCISVGCRETRLAGAEQI